MFFLINFVSLLAGMINLCLLPCCRFVFAGWCAGRKHLILFMKITNACHGRGKFIVSGQRGISCDTSSGFLAPNDATWCFKRLLRFTLMEKCLFLQFTSRPSHYRRASIRKEKLLRPFWAQGWLRSLWRGILRFRIPSRAGSAFWVDWLVFNLAKASRKKQLH